MLIIHIRDKPGAAMDGANGPPATISIRTPGTFPPLAIGMEVWKAKRRARGSRPSTRRPTREEIELLINFISGWDGFVYKGTPLECNRSNVAAYLTAAPWARRQVEEAIEEFKHSGTF